MYKIILNILIILSLFSCKPNKEIVLKNVHSTDSTYIVKKINTKDSTIEKINIAYQVADSSNIKLKLAIDTVSNQIYISEIQSYKSGKNLHIPNIKIHNNTLTGQCFVDSFAIYSIFKERYEKSELSNNKDYSKTKVDIEKKEIKQNNTIISKIEDLVFVIVFLTLLFVLLKYIIKW